MKFKNIKGSNISIINKKRMIRTAVATIGAFLITGFALRKDNKAYNYDANLSSNMYLASNYDARSYRIEKLSVDKSRSNPIGMETESNFISPNNYFTQSDNKLADDVIRGNYGNGEERKQALKEDGYDYETIQSLVNLKWNNQDYTIIHPNYIYDASSEQYKSQETTDTLKIYNKWLESIGSKEILTESDIEIIEANTNEKIISIKNSECDNYSQVSGEYLVVKNIKGQIELLFQNNQSYDLLTGKKRESLDYNIISSLGECIKENNISIIGFTLQHPRSWDTKDIKFIKENYSEDVLRCLKENGLPLPCYDAVDIYRSQEQEELII